MYDVQLLHSSVLDHLLFLVDYHNAGLVNVKYDSNGGFRRLDNGSEVNAGSVKEALAKLFGVVNVGWSNSALPCNPCQFRGEKNNLFNLHLLRRSGGIVVENKMLGNAAKRFIVAAEVFPVPDNVWFGYYWNSVQGLWELLINNKNGAILLSVQFPSAGNSGGVPVFRSMGGNWGECPYMDLREYIFRG